MSAADKGKAAIWEADRHMETLAEARLGCFFYALHG